MAFLLVILQDAILDFDMATLPALKPCWTEFLTFSFHGRRLDFIGQSHHFKQSLRGDPSAACARTLMIVLLYYLCERACNGGFICWHTYEIDVAILLLFSFFLFIFNDGVIAIVFDFLLDTCYRSVYGLREN